MIIGASFSAGICLYKLDSNTGGQLNMSGWSRAGLNSGSGNSRKTVGSELPSN
jgi:hypothetical protein